MNIHQRHSLALRIAAELADENTELRMERDALIDRCQRAETERDNHWRALIHTQESLIQVTHERDDARKGWAEALKSRPLNGVHAESKGSGEKGEESF